MQIQFLGANRTVTGSKYLVAHGQTQILVDCGLFQGLKELRLRNRAEFPVDLKGLDAVILTHAHLDHSGYLPLLIRNGFKGPVFSTAATLDLCSIILPDSGRLQEEEAKFANKVGSSKHHPALPLYTEEDAMYALDSIRTVAYYEKRAIGDLTFEFIPSGHILGAAFVAVTAGGKTILFSGDIGRPNDLIMKAPDPVAEADFLVIESTYGDRLHERKEPLDALADVLRPALKRGAVVLIPAFSVGRSQSLLFGIHRLISAGQIPQVPVYLNSPMSINATEIYCHYQSEHRLSVEDCRDMCGVARYVHTPEESRALNTMPGPMIIVSASGMLTGGRILHHVKAFAGDDKNLILLPGFQAAGTRGAALQQGARKLRIFGEDVAIHADVKTLEMYSAHADQSELMDWLENFSEPPKMTFITHGEPTGSEALQRLIRNKPGWKAEIPDFLEKKKL